MTGEPLTALIVEDDANVVDFIRRTMVVLGHECVCVTNLQDARDAYGRNAFDYVVLDLKIPAMADLLFPDMDCGMTFLSEIGQRGGNGRMPVLVMTTYAGEGFDMAIRLAELGASKCITKPLDDKPLSEIIREVLAKRILAGRGNAVTGSNSESADGEAPIVELGVLGGPYKLLGRNKSKPLTGVQYEVIRQLIAAGEEGFCKDRLEAIRPSALGALRRLSQDPDWKAVIRFPGKAGLGYRLRRPRRR